MRPRALIVTVAGSLVFATPALAAGTVSITAIQGPSPYSVSVPVAVEGQTAAPAITAAFTDTNAVAPSNLTVAINWGDGSTSSNQSGPNFDANLIVTEVGGAGATTYTVSDNHTFPEEGNTSMTLSVTENANAANTDSANTSAQISDAPLSVASSAPTLITGTGSSATHALASYAAAIGGVDNGTAVGERGGGFRRVNWDGVALDGSDPGSTVITEGHVVALPFNGMSGLGLTVAGPLAVANDSFASVNPSAAGLFPAFSAPNVAAPFNGPQLELDVVAPGSVPAMPQASRGLGVMFVNVQQPGTTIDYFNGNALLDEVSVPTSASAGQLTFAGDLFSAPVVTRVVIALGGATIFSFDGTTTTPGPSNTPSTNLVALDDVVLAEPAPQDTGIVTTAGVTFAGVIARFADTDQSGNAHDYQANIDWGDGSRSPGTVSAGGSGGFTVSGNHTYAQSGTYTVLVGVSDFGGAGHSSRFLALVAARPTATSVSCTPSSVAVGGSTTCTATVLDTLAGTSAPTGTVFFAAASGLGGFNGGSCTLSGTGAASATCRVTYSATHVASGRHSLIASYAGDAAHSVSNGSVTVTVHNPGCTIAMLGAKATGGRLRARISCDRPAQVTIGGTITIARKGRHPRQQLRLAKRALQVESSRTITLSLPALATLREAAKRRQRISLTLVVNATSTTRSRSTTSVRSVSVP